MRANPPAGAGCHSSAGTRHKQLAVLTLCALAPQPAEDCVRCWHEARQGCANIEAEGVGDPVTVVRDALARALQEGRPLGPAQWGKGISSECSCDVVLPA